MNIVSYLAKYIYSYESWNRKHSAVLYRVTSHTTSATRGRTILIHHIKEGPG